MNCGQLAAPIPARPRKRGPLRKSQEKRDALPRLSHRSEAARMLTARRQRHATNFDSGNGEPLAGYRP